MQNQNWPQWTTELTTNFVPGEDQLGVEGAAQGYQHWLIPGITTVTDRARYYSFYAWILHRFITLPGSSRLLKDFRGPFYKRHEVALILGAYSHHLDRESVGGLVGGGVNNSKARRWWDGGDPVSLDMVYFENVPLGGLGQYYLTAMQAMGIVGISSHPNWAYPLTPRGEELALAYQKSISQTSYAKDLAEQEQLTALSHADALEFGGVGCLCPEALAMGDDLPLLRKSFFRLEEKDPENPHVRRRLALAVALDLVRGAGGRFQQGFLRPTLYLGEYADGIPFSSPPELQDWAMRWKLVEIRHIYTLGLQCLWAAFLLRLKISQNGILIADYKEWLRETVSPEYFDLSLGKYLDNLCSEIGLNGHWQTVQRDFNLACQQGSQLDEYSLFLKALRSSTNAKSLIECGIRILAQIYLRFYHWHAENNPIWLEMANRERLPLSGYFNFTQGVLAAPENTLGSWLEKLYREYIFGQHELIALDKLRYQEYDTFKFSYRDGLFFWPFSSPDAYREPIRLAANRLLNALSILTDLGLVFRNEESEYSLSSDGEDLLERCVRGIHDDH